MKVKTSISIPEELLALIDEYSRDFGNRSLFIEAATRAFVEQMGRRERDNRDLSIINRHARRLNEEASDVLTYQVVP